MEIRISLSNEAVHCVHDTRTVVLYISCELILMCFLSSFYLYLCAYVVLVCELILSQFMSSFCLDL